VERGEGAFFMHIGVHTPQRWTLRDGTPVRLREIAPHDSAALKTLIESLSARDRRYRFHAGFGQLGAAWIERMARLQGPLEHAWVVTIPSWHGDAVIADLRLHRCATTNAAELALLVAPAWRCHGLGQQALRALKGYAASLDCPSLHGAVLRENSAMLALMARSGFQSTDDADEANAIRLSYVLREREPRTALRWSYWSHTASLCARSAAAAWRACLTA
jgi:RimJ/RimL family protein N-acetyltransferase